MSYLRLQLLLAYLQAFSICCYLAQDVSNFRVKELQYERMFLDLFSKTLKDDNILMIVEPDLQIEINFDLLIKNGLSKTQSYTLSTWNTESLHETHPKEFIRGDFMTVVFIFESDPTPFLDDQEKSWIFNPTYLILLNMNSDLNMDVIARNSVLQRSMNLVTIERDIRNGEFLVSTVSHTTYHNYSDSTVMRSLGTFGSKELVTKETLFERDMTNLQGAHLQLASFCDDFPFMYIDKDDLSLEDFYIHNCSGSSFDVFDILGKKMNFTYDFQMHTPDWSWGSKENGSWIGMLGQLHSREKDILINNFLLTEERYYEFDSSFPYFQEGFALMLKIPPPAPKWVGLLYPFSNTVWISIICVAVGVGLIWTAGLFLFPDKMDVTRVFLQIFSGITRINYEEQFERNWVHQIALTWWLVGIVLSSAYTCNLVAYLTVSVPTKRIETINQLADSHLKVLMHDYGNFVPGALKSSSDPSLAKLGKEMELFPEYENYWSIGFPSVQRYTHALLNGASYIAYIRNANNLTDTTYIMKEVLYPSYLVYYWPKNTPQSPAISKNLQRLFEGHIIRATYNKHLSDKMKKSQNIENMALAHLGTEHLAGVFVLALAGYTLAFLVFLGELLLVKCSSRRTANQKEGLEMDQMNK